MSGYRRPRANAEETARLLERAGPNAPVLAISASIFGLSTIMPVVFQQGGQRLPSPAGDWRA
jgi:hypothetical protein